MTAALVACMSTREALSDRRRLLDKLLRELVRSEAQAIEHAPREAKRIGETPPVQVLRDVATHAMDTLSTRAEAGSARRCRRSAISSPIAFTTPSVHIVRLSSIFATVSTSFASCEKSLASKSSSHSFGGVMIG
jgi:hypothetical protein